MSDNVSSAVFWVCMTVLAILTAGDPDLLGTINRQRRKWVTDYPVGVSLGTLQRPDDWLRGRIEGVRLLGHAVVVTEDNDGELRFFALPAAK